MTLKKKVKTWKFKTAKEAKDFFLLALQYVPVKGSWIIEFLKPNKVKITYYPNDPATI